MKNLIKKLVPKQLAPLAKRSLGFIGSVLEQYPQDSIALGYSSGHVFAGYYDVSPFSHDGRYILANLALTENVSPHNNHPDLHLGVYDLKEQNSQIKIFSQTKTWNWQQGCRLQWYPQKDKTHDVIYNTTVDGSYCAVIQNIHELNAHKTISVPVYSVSRDGKYALGLNFNILHHYRPGYGYNNVEGSGSQNCINFVDIISGEINPIVTINDVKQYHKTIDMDDSEHYLNHLCFSPDGNKFMVTHLWLTPTGKRKTRILIIDLNGKILFCPNNTGTTSHYCWVDNDSFIIFGSHDGVSYRYYCYTMNASVNFDHTILSLLGEDGHPSVHQNSFLTDSYPNIFRQQKLFLYDKKDCKLSTIGKFHTPLSFSGEVRCDLHPRFSPNADLICVDVVKHNRRHMCVFKT